MEQDLLEQIAYLENAITKAFGKAEIESAFIEHCRGGFLTNLNSAHIDAISKDNYYMAPMTSGKLSMRIINNEKFVYAASIYLPNVNIMPHAKADDNDALEVKGQKTWTGTGNFSKNPLPPLIWSANSQVLVIKGSGTCKVRILQVPRDTDINNFSSGVTLTEIDEQMLSDGASISNWDSNRIIEIIEVDEAVVVQTLTINNPRIELHWIFNENLVAFDALPSKPFLARLMAFLNLLIEMEIDAPQELYDKIFIYGDPLLKIRAIEAMLLEQHPLAIDHLRSAIDSPLPFLSDRAKILRDKLLATNS
ncbi:hypothetical protein [Mucilaginibacter sp.]|uniref:hypothetical protein n=1 Tax=Mucilaginibacter sp. TaxID=1882438 RepID=UPI0025D5D82A|nr:hypothetical protein [Mucilaginibacter sp.]